MEEKPARIPSTGMAVATRTIVIGTVATFFFRWLLPDLPPDIVAEIPIIALAATAWLGKKSRDMVHAYEEDHEIPWYVKGAGLG